MTEENGRTHEPSLRELTAELDGMHAWMESELKGVRSVMDERHERYKERADAAEKQVGVAFDASEKANAAANTAQKDYNIGHNDLLRKMDGQYKDTLPRFEADSKFANVDTQIEGLKKEIQGLRESRSEGAGARGQLTDTRDRSQWTLGLVITTGTSLIVALLGGLYVVVRAATGH